MRQATIIQHGHHGARISARLFLIFLALLSLILPERTAAASLDFRSLDTSAGLADSHVACILKDHDGFLWIGTAAGLCRYDGFRFKNFYSSTADKSSLLSNQIESLTQDNNRQIWVQTNEGYCIYNPDKENFITDMATWMKQHGMEGVPSRVFVDSKGFLWIAVDAKGCYYYNPSTNEHYLFKSSRRRGCLPTGAVTGITQSGNSLVLSFEDGKLARLDGPRKRIVWVNDYLAISNHHLSQYYSTYIDSHYNYWVSNHAKAHTWVYSSKKRQWFSSPTEFFASLGMKGMGNVFVKDVKEDSRHNLWLATEHEGLFIANIHNRSIQHVVYDAKNPNTLLDNTLQSIYIDNDDAVWIGTYKNGIAYYSPSLSHYPTIMLGDICTIAIDRDNNYWCGTNDNGLLCYNPSTGTTRNFHKQQTGLLTDVVVSSLSARDGSLWFGSFNGGLTHYVKGSFRAYNQQNSALANNSVWSLAEDPHGNLIIGTLGGGVQMLNPQSGEFTTFNTFNSKLPSRYVAVVDMDKKGRVVVGHSLGVSLVDFSRNTVSPLPPTVDGSNFTSLSVNDICVDSRGLLWNANMSGLDVYDPKSRRVYHLYKGQQMACSVCEDRDGVMWATLPNEVVRIVVTRKDNALNFFVNSFDELDGLQKRRYNYRSIVNDKRGHVIVGGQDGINVIPSRSRHKLAAGTRVLFPGIVLFDHPLSVGENYMGRVILDRSVNTSHQLNLKYDENAFTVLLATNHVSVPEKCHFMYRLKGFGDDKWLTTVESQPSITYTNLHPGTYTLQVRVVERDGTVTNDISELRIHIAPPFYMSTWAYIIYILLMALAVWAVWHITLRRQIEKMRIEQIRQEAERNKKMDEMKLAFLTDISHELRTPLSLVISPVKAMIDKETDGQKKNRLQLILRNAERLLNLVNQTLDIRKIETHAMQLNCKDADMVRLVHDIADDFSRLSQQNIHVTFTSNVESLRIPFDMDKMQKVITNLLSNAYKFTPEGGSVSVKVLLEDKEAGKDIRNLLISVADTGCGISDEDKKHVFDRFYQTSHRKVSEFGGSGLGLNISYEYVAMHGGTITVADNNENADKGTVFTVTLPVALKHEVTTCETVSNEDNKNMSPKADDDVDMHDKEVLVVDDSDDFLSFMSEMLGEHYRVCTAVNGKDAVEKIQQHRPDIILSDVMMPEMDGNELCRYLKDTPETASIPFVMLTARLSTAHKIEGFTSGADAYITKPFDFDLLLVRIGNLLRSHDSQPHKIEPRITEEKITSVDQQLVDKATAYVEKNLSNADLSVEMMSEALGMSRVHLYKRLLSITGNTPSEFIRIIRLKHAARLLREGQLNVSEVAYKVGFNMPRYFSRYFKEYYGIGPSQYKNKQT